jgi:uncharacterized protein YdiU (UPF0061 family)
LTPLSAIAFRKEFISTFPGDQTGNSQPRQTPGVLYSKAHPTPVKKPTLLAWSQELAQELGLTIPENETDLGVLSGNTVTESMYPYAACYAGHQFGHWAGQLGDGRAITLGELETSKGNFELQLKGAGPTAYSRRADGRAVLRSSVREYLMSEAMHYLGVPTTRALSLVATGEPVMRDMFYDGNAGYEPGAIVMRVAPSFLRFGNFEMLAARKETELLQQLTDWTIDHFYPHIKGENKLLDWFAEVVDRTAALMTEWMRVGFVHGVMNTDNMSALGLTIDYGPYSFLDNYDPAFTPNTTDLPGRRYAFGNQPSVAYWNLGCLAGAIAPLLESEEELVAILKRYETIFPERYHAMMARKLGLETVNEETLTLVSKLETLLATLQPDMTIFFQLLIDVPAFENVETALAHFQESLYRELSDNESILLFDFLQNYHSLFTKNQRSAEDSFAIMRLANPRFILRNYLLHQAIEEMQEGKDDLFRSLQSALKDPYAKTAGQFFQRRPDWATEKAGCSMLSCSS